MSGIAFTRAWEDDRIDLAALAIQPAERVLAIAASGDIPLALAAEGAAEVIAVDLNPAQLHLSALKIAAAGWDADKRYRWFECGRVTEDPQRVPTSCDETRADRKVRRRSGMCHEGA